MSGGNPLPRGWAWATLGDMLPIQYGKGLVESVRRNGPVPVYGSSGIVGYHDQALTAGETLIVGRKGSVGRVHYSAVPCWPIDTVFYTATGGGLDLRFSSYLLTSLRLVQHDKSTAVPGLSRDDYNVQTVPVPPLAEQHRIVAAIEEQLTRLGEGVAALKRAQARLKRYRASVLKAAVEGKLTEAWRAANPPSETAAELLKRILAERRACWEADLKAKGKDPTKVRYEEPRGPDTSGLPAVPEGWGWATVEQVGDVGTGATPLRSRADYYLNGDVPWVTSGALNFESVTQATEFITAKAVKETNAKVFRSGTLLVAMYGEGKTRGKVAELRIDAATNQACAGITLSGTVDSLRGFIKCFLQSGYEDLRLRASGGVQPNLNLSIIRDTRFALPPAQEQAQIICEVERRLSVVSALERTIDISLKRAERLRQSILATAFAGMLVAQDPHDEPASVLLERIRAEREETPPSPSPTRGGRIGTSGHSGQLARGNGQPRSRPGREISGSKGGGLVGATNSRDQAGSARRRALAGDIISASSETPRKRLLETGEFDADEVPSIEGTQLPLVWGATPVATVDRRANAQSVPSRAEAPSDV